MSEKSRFDILAGKGYQAIRRPDPVIEASDVEAAFSVKDSWTWIDGRQYTGPVASSKPALVGGEVFGPNNRTGFISGFIGPCGKPKTIEGLSPYQVGPAFAAGIYSICRSDSRSCSRCPMNPNRAENEA